MKLLADHPISELPPRVQPTFSLVWPRVRLGTSLSCAHREHCEHRRLLRFFLVQQQAHTTLNRAGINTPPSFRFFEFQGHDPLWPGLAWPGLFPETKLMNHVAVVCCHN
jgi:hypothetical protein